MAPGPPEGVAQTQMRIPKSLSLLDLKVGDEHAIIIHDLTKSCLMITGELSGDTLQ